MFDNGTGPRDRNRPLQSPWHPFDTPRASRRHTGSHELPAVQFRGGEKIFSLFQSGIAAWIRVQARSVIANP